MRELFPRGGEARVVQLHRRDATAHAISYARALLSGIWRKEQEPDDRPEPEYSSNALAHAARLIEQQEAIWVNMFRDLRVEPLALWYEDVLANPMRLCAPWQTISESGSIRVRRSRFRDRAPVTGRRACLGRTSRRG
jgi:LPS sulfotransferase NodH